MTNAQFWVTFKVTLKDREFDEMISLASPDLVNTKEAQRRAIKTAEMRLRRRLEKKWKFNAVRDVACIRCQCVG